MPEQSESTRDERVECSPSVSCVRASDDSQVQEAADALNSIWPSRDAGDSPRTAVILGSGLHGAATEALKHGAAAVPYLDVSGMPVPAVEGHVGRFISGGTRLKNTVLLQGRSHFYEGWSLNRLTYSIRVLACAGVQTLIITNAAGGIRDDMQPGDVMLISDHLSFVDLTALSERSGPSVGSRSSGPAWSQELINSASQVETSLRVHVGCYAMMSGPNYETPAEVRMLQRLGADAVGMSTVPEAIVASDLGMEVLGVSCITNAAAGLSDTPLSHHEVGQTAASIEPQFVEWMWQLIKLAERISDR